MSNERLDLPPAQLSLARRRFLQTAAAGLGAFGFAQAGFGQSAATDVPATQGLRGGKSKARDQDILNFALNLEYLEAEFYLLATTGVGLQAADTGSDDPNSPAAGATTGGRQVTFATDAVRQYAVEIAADELAHVRLLRTATKKSVAKPAIDLSTSFTAAARAANLVGATEEFDAFANENNFLLAAYIFEDVGVTAYKGAAPLLQSPAILDASAGILGAEAYHAGLIRTILASRGLTAQANAISDLRDGADGTPDDDQGILNADGTFNFVPTDANGLAFGRTPGQVLAITYLSPTAESGGFFPNGVNGRIR
ncbi:MAG: conserved exported protein [Phycisphaerales bacterium]|nr:conserved exported protein [Phycisphaerales bacterium]